MFIMVKTNLKTLAYNTIKQKIVTCEYAPGTFLNEEILTDELKISRTPIRDALSRLEQEGLIEIKPKKGITVTALSIKDVNMIFEIRKLYEPYILKNYGSFLDEDKLNEFYHIFSHKDANSECFQNNNYFYDLDSSFHQMIVDACPNVYLRQNYALIQTQSERFRFMTGNMSPACKKTGIPRWKSFCITWTSLRDLLLNWCLIVLIVIILGSDWFWM